MTTPPPVLDELIRALEKAGEALTRSEHPYDRAWGDHLAADARLMKLLRLSDRWRGEDGG